MPHDRDDFPLKQGGRVLVPCRVSRFRQDNGPFNVVVVTEEKLPDGPAVEITLNSKQVICADLTDLERADLEENEPVEQAQQSSLPAG